MPAARPGRSLTIGAVLAQLKPEFPDISISKIRFLESEGLVKPGRTASGYRAFSDGDLDRLRYILTAQRDRFWPLRVIREALDARDRGLEVPAYEASGPRVPPGHPDPDVPTTEALAAAPPTLRLTAAEVASASGLPAGMLDALGTYGLLKPGRDGHYPASALPIARAVAQLSSYGVEPRHLRPFRTAADREIGLVEQVVAPLRGRTDEQGRHASAAFLAHCIALHVALVKAALDD